MSQRLGVHRSMVREAIGSPLPKSRENTERPRWKLRAAIEFVDGVLEANRKAPRKQRPHARWERELARPANERGRVPLRLSACDARGVSGSHELAFAYFGSVFHKMRCDNLTSDGEEDSKWTLPREDGASSPFARIGDSKRSFGLPAAPHEEGGIACKP